MNQNKQPYGHLIWMVGVILALILILVSGFIGQKAWGHQAELTKNFESCMERAPFKTILNTPKPEKVLSVEKLQNYFDEFDRIYNETGLPPIWNGETLVPWKIYHRDSIKIAKQCHTELGIAQPQKQLKGTYSKPVWDPNSKIWANS